MSMIASPHTLPMNVMLVGMPVRVKPFGTVTAGWPVRFVSCAFSTPIGVAPGPPLAGARYTSTSAMTRIIASMTKVRTRDAWMYSTAGISRAVR